MSAIYKFPETTAPPTKQLFSRRGFLPCGQNNLWYIQSGVVRTMTYLEDGTAVTLGIWSDGDIVGDALSTIEPYIVECLTSVEVTQFKLRENHQLMKTLTSHIEQTEELMVIRSQKTIDSMLIKLLAWLAKKFGKAVDNGQLIDLRITNQDIADMLGPTRVTISRALSQFEEQGVIKRLPLHRIVLCEEQLFGYAS
ncbi:Crp/Fnr family transcriptional regulator [Brunnivagina elsteri]|uniref:Crp/Fnr family transcriptional regulator n=1 Tax=Brunnivagina elsteri CCALA 953 TaxID=987040 RepID=A0A2A2TNX7_9CYAN|nr:Crp/Fnr family transcriptional regulator [Calothrix elsteri]PAX60153.1 Crp/Fnr family transcriptional regulator [Calothrix elsteri CCALA 953]